MFLNFQNVLGYCKTAKMFFFALSDNISFTGQNIGFHSSFDGYGKIVSSTWQDGIVFKNMNSFGILYLSLNLIRKKNKKQ